MKTKTITRSFAAGEIDPDLHARIDLAKFQTGVKRAKNFMVLPQGPLVNRPGTRFVSRMLYAGTAPILFPFAFSTTQTYIFAMADGLARVYSQGGPVLNAAKSCSYSGSGTTLNVPSHGYTSGAILYSLVTSPIPSTRRFHARLIKCASVVDTNNITVTDLDNQPITGAAAWTGTVALTVTFTIPWDNAHLLDLHYVQNADVVTFVHPLYAPREIRRTSATVFSVTTIDFQPSVTAPTGVTVTATPASGSVVNYYKVTTLSDDGSEESPPSAIASATNDLTVGANANYIQATTGIFIPPSTFMPVAKVCNVYKAKNGVFGFIGQFLSGINATMGYTPLIDRNIDPDITRQPPADAPNPFSGDGNYPNAVTYFEQRRCFAGTANNPQGVWMTRSGTENNFVIPVPVTDDSPIVFNVAARDANAIRHLVPTSSLLALTNTAEMRVSNPNGGPLTPASVSVRPDTYVGASNVQPAITSNSVLFVGAYGQHVWEMLYSWQSQGYTVNDLSILAPHLFDGAGTDVFGNPYNITQIAFTRAINRTLWAVRNDGVLLSCTYVPEHQIAAWTTHDLGGTVKSVASVFEEGAESLYVTVERLIGAAFVHFVERIRPRQMVLTESSYGTMQVQDPWFADCAVRYVGASTSVVYGLHYLEGRQVVANARGRVTAPITVTDGAITLPFSSTDIVVGLPYVCDMETLPVALEQAAGAGVGSPKNIEEVCIRVRDTIGLQVGPTFDDLVPWKQTTAAAMGDPVGPYTGVVEIRPVSEWDQDATVCIRQDAPLPITVQSLTIKVAIGG